jgi:hypothetical protein
MVSPAISRGREPKIEKERLADGMAGRSFGLVLPEFIVLFAVFETDGRQLRFQCIAIYIHIVAEIVERAIVVTEQHIHRAEKNHRVIGQSIHLFVLPIKSATKLRISSE